MERINSVPPKIIKNFESKICSRNLNFQMLPLNQNFLGMSTNFKIGSSIIIIDKSTS